MKFKEYYLHGIIGIEYHKCVLRKLDISHPLQRTRESTSKQFTFAPLPVVIDFTFPFISLFISIEVISELQWKLTFFLSDNLF